MADRGRLSSGQGGGSAAPGEDGDDDVERQPLAEPLLLPNDDRNGGGDGDRDADRDGLSTGASSWQGGEGGEVGPSGRRRGIAGAIERGIQARLDDLAGGWNTITARVKRVKPPPRLQTLLVDLFARLPASEHTYRDQFQYVCQWQLWGAEALDVFFLDRWVPPGAPWPWWLKYNPPWLMAYLTLVCCFASGCCLHCLVYQGYPVPEECPEERRFRIHYVYGFDAYLGLMVIVSIICLFTFPHDVRIFAVEGIVLTVLWIAGNALGLMAMYGQSNTGIRCFVAGQVAWTTILSAMVIFDLVRNFSAVALYHLVVVIFFWIAVLAYMIPYGPTPGLWGLYVENRRISLSLHRAYITLTVLVVMACSLLVLYAAGDVLWVIISGSILRQPDLPQALHAPPWPQPSGPGAPPST